ncbi:hypothetical protein LPUS_00586 [Lasallia pustulata]|uniref:Uncharacterized protein n=1 Tax=Lasallia pustulata TaxID=136370 RepID=A0A1W5CZU7_9LECA|nr:hypothetical protein LPUS_00586 [Lasallia pustulata]
MQHTTCCTGRTYPVNDFDFKDTNLWESFKEDFEDFTEQTFKDASNHEIRRLRTILRKRGVWVQKRARTSIALSLYNTLKEEERTEWTEFEIKSCHTKEAFTSNHIFYLLRTDFDRNPQYPAHTHPRSGPSPAPPPGPSVPQGL